MNTSTLKDQWTTLKPKIKAKWPKLSEQDVNTTSPSCDWLASKVKDRYGVTPDDAKRQVDQFCTENNISRDAAETSASSSGSNQPGASQPSTGQSGMNRPSKGTGQQSERDSGARTQEAE